MRCGSIPACYQVRTKGSSCWWAVCMNMLRKTREQAFFLIVSTWQIYLIHSIFSWCLFTRVADLWRKLISYRQILPATRQFLTQESFPGSVDSHWKCRDASKWLKQKTVIYSKDIFLLRFLSYACDKKQRTRNHVCNAGITEMVVKV